MNLASVVIRGFPGIAKAVGVACVHPVGVLVSVFKPAVCGRLANQGRSNKQKQWFSFFRNGKQKKQQLVYPTPW